MVLATREMRPSHVIYIRSIKQARAMWFGLGTDGLVDRHRPMRRRPTKSPLVAEVVFCGGAHKASP